MKQKIIEWIYIIPWCRTYDHCIGLCNRQWTDEDYRKAEELQERIYG